MNKIYRQAMSRTIQRYVIQNSFEVGAYEISWTCELKDEPGDMIVSLYYS